MLISSLTGAGTGWQVSHILVSFGICWVFIYLLGLTAGEFDWSGTRTDDRRESVQSSSHPDGAIEKVIRSCSKHPNYQRIEPFHLYRNAKLFYKNWNSSSKRQLCCRKPETLVCKSFTCELGDQSSNLWPEAGGKWIWSHFSYLSGRYLNHRDMMYSKESLPHVGANGLN